MTTLENVQSFHKQAEDCLDLVENCLKDTDLDPAQLYQDYLKLRLMDQMVLGKAAELVIKEYLASWIAQNDDFKADLQDTVQEVLQGLDTTELTNKVTEWVHTELYERIIAGFDYTSPAE